MKIRVAFYKYDKKMPNAAISAWTWLFNPFTPSYSHVEIGVHPVNSWNYFSSTNRDGANGTRWISSKKLFKHKERWDVYEIEVKDIKKIIARADTILGRPYDWLGIAGFATLFGLLNSKMKWYCSEACYYVLTGKRKKRISPRRFYSYIKRNFNASLRKA